MARVLYISYDGLMEPLGQSQVFQYLQKLARDHEITLVTYEKKFDWGDKNRRVTLARTVQETGIFWIPLRYHKAPSVMATAYDLFIGLIVCAWSVKKHRICIVHARSYVPSVIALALKKLMGVCFLFDMRGFWPDEKVDGGSWSQSSRIYKVTKWLERKFLIQADAIVSLTRTAVEDIKLFPYLENIRKRFEVIPTCANLELFRPLGLHALGGKEDRSFVLGYVGSVGTFYLFDEVLKSFKVLYKIKDNAKLLIINRGQHGYIYKCMKAHKIEPDRVELKSVPYNKVAMEINRMDAGIFYIKPIFSKRASAPTKFGEFLGCGIPCLSNAGVGDSESILVGENVGVAIGGFSDEDHERGIQKILRLVKDSRIMDRCLEVAKTHFSLGKGVRAYDNLYRELQDEVMSRPQPVGTG